MLICEELPKLKDEKKTNPTEEWATYRNRQFTEKRDSGPDTFPRMLSLTRERNESEQKNGSHLSDWPKPKA